MALAELRELKIQFQKLVDKGFIQPSTTLWGSSRANCEIERWDFKVMHWL